MFYCSRITGNIHEGEPIVQCSYVGCHTLIGLNQLLRFPNGPSGSIPPGSICSIRVCEHSEPDLCVARIEPSHRPPDLVGDWFHDISGNR